MAPGHAAASHTSHSVFLPLLLNSHVSIRTLAECIWSDATVEGMASLIKIKGVTCPPFYGKFAVGILQGWGRYLMERC